MTFIFDPAVWPWKYQSYFSSYFEPAEYIRWYLLCCFFAAKYAISAVSSSLTCNCISSKDLVAFQPRKTSSSYIHSTLLVYRQSPKMHMLLFRIHFHHHQRYLVCSLLVSKYVLSKIFWRFNFNSINHSYLVSVYTVNTLSTPYFFV